MTGDITEYRILARTNQSTGKVEFIPQHRTRSTHWFLRYLVYSNWWDIVKSQRFFNLKEAEDFIERSRKPRYTEEVVKKL